MSTCNRFDLQTLGSQPVMPKYLPDHWSILLEGQSNHLRPIHPIKVRRVFQHSWSDARALLTYMATLVNGPLTYFTEDNLR